jgi:glutamine synthetase
MGKICVEYIWSDGKGLRSKTKIIPDPFLKTKINVSKLPSWGFDGSSTGQAETKNSDCLLEPVKVISDPFLGGKNLLVLCEVFNPDGTPHKTNTRAKLRKSAEKYKHHAPLFGLEQEYTLFDHEGIWPYRWTPNRYPEEQGKYYCGVGCDEVYGAQLVKEHTLLCMEAGLSISGTNAEVMPAQWEFQIGPLDALGVADEVLLARWILYTLGVKHHISIKLYPKPIKKGKWNGAGMHMNFSTKAMRAKNGILAIRKACQSLKKYHSQHIAVYGEGNNDRLTGENETQNFRIFSIGDGDRGASIRIPISVALKKKGYLEDRRPAANADPYKITTAMLETVCGKGFFPIDDWIDMQVTI